MEEIREAAIACYKNASQEKQQRARNFFKLLDVDGDGTVDVQKFINALSRSGDEFVNYVSFVKELDRDCNGSMGFAEVLSFLHIVDSRRPFCGGCGILLKGLFFTCVKCHGSCNHHTFNLCSACFGAKRFSHLHDAFLDNYALLAHKRLITEEGDQRRPNRRQGTPSSVNYRQGTHANSKEIVVNILELLGSGAHLGIGISHLASVAKDANPCSIM